VIPNIPGFPFPTGASLPGFPSAAPSVATLGPATRIFRGGNYQNPLQRQFGITVAIEEFNLPTLPDRMADVLQEALIFHLKDAAEAVISDAQMQLVPGHGYDTGLLHDSLVYRLAEHLLATGVFYDLLSEQAYYWRYVEFGHWTTAGNWWEGYHFLENAILMNEGHIRRTVREAWADTMVKLAAEARAAYGGPQP
jgi:hypothetical protein